MHHETGLFPPGGLGRRVDFIDLSREYAEIKAEIDRAISDVLGSGIFINGEKTHKFEREFAEYTGTRFAVSVNSGSDALFLTVKAMGIGNGDEVITASNSYVSTADAIYRNAARPVFADIDPVSFNIDPDQIRRKITRKTKAIIPVHIYGQPANMEEILEIARDRDLKIVEDSCQAHGALYKGKKAGAIGDAGTFSFYPTKNVGAYGDAGIITTNSERIFERLTKLRNYGSSIKYYHEEIGINSRMDEIQASILSVKLDHLDQWNQRRREAAKLYSELLEKSRVTVPVELPDRKHVYHIYAVRTRERNALQAKLAQKGVQTSIHYPVPIHRQKAYSRISGNEKLPVTEAVSDEILSLPVYPHIREDEIEHVSEVIMNA